MDTQLRQLVVGDFPGHREATISHFKGFTYLIRDSNLSKTLPEDHPHNDLISNIQNASCTWVLSCSTQTVRSFDGRIFYKKTLAIRTVVVFSKFLFCLSEFQHKRVFSCHEESYRIGHNQMVKALALWKPALFRFLVASLRS